MFRTLLLTSLVLPLVAQIPASPIDPAWMFRVSTSTYHANGNKTGASSGGYSLTAGRPIVMYPYSRRTLCLSSSAVPQEPDDAGFGWRVQVTPLRNEGGLVAQVEWQRLWNRSEKLTNGLRGSVQVTFKPGEKILFDYIAAGPTNDCSAIGMALEMGLDSLARTELVEADLWLVRKLPNGSEQSQHQTMRLSPGAGVDFYFDDVSLGDFFYFNTTTAPSLKVRTSGRLTLEDIVGGTSQVDVNIGQDVLDATSKVTRGGSSGFRLKAAANEVVAVQVPNPGPFAERIFSLRLQMRQLR